MTHASVPGCGALRRLAWAGAACAAGLMLLPAGAQIRTDGSLGGAVLTLSGPQVLIPQSLGRLSGTNLFHSFATFGIGYGESATFSTSSPGITHVVSRVTGGLPTRIDGTLRLSAAQGAPAFFFINPAGVTVGASGVVDVPGALHLGTADYLVFADGRFHADATRASSLSAAPVQAFGFLGNTRGVLRLEGGAPLRPGVGQALSLVAGDVVLDGATAATAGGDLRVAAAGDRSAEVALGGALPATLGGTVVLRNGAGLLSVAPDASPGGALRVSAGALQLDGARILGTGGSTAAAGGGNVDISVTGDTTLAGAARVLAVAQGAGAAGTVNLRTRTLDVDGGSAVGSLAAQGTGAAGAVTVEASGAGTLRNGGWVFSSSAAQGAAGAVRVSAASLLLDGGSISSNTVGTGAAAAGAVEVNVSGRLSLRNGASIDSSTLTSGAAGDLRVRAADLDLRGGSRIQSRALDGTGRAGTVDVAVTGDLDLAEAASLSSATATAGDAGSVRVQARQVRLDGGSAIDSTAGLDSSGQGGSVSVDASGALQLSGGAHITALTGGSGHAGAVTVNAATVTLQGRAYLSTTATAESSGNAGRVVLRASGAVDLSDGAFITSDTGGRGHAGAVSMQAGSLTLASAGRISSVVQAGSSGQGGQIDLDVAGALRLGGGSGTVASGGATVSTSTFAAGAGGAVRVRAAAVDINGSGAGLVSFAHAGSRGNAGSIDVVANGAVTIRQGGISTSTAGAGAAGQIQVHAGTLLLSGPEAGISAAALPGSGAQVGNVTLRADTTLRLENGAVVSIANAGVLPAGVAPPVPTRLTLAAPELSLAGALVTAEAQGHVAASTIEMQAGQRLLLDRSAVRTTAVDGDGGAIRVTGTPALWLRDTQITTSVSGSSGNGGDITLQAGALALDHGFVQANTAARNASGGRVVVAVPVLLARGQALAVGGNVPQVFDAAASGGPSVIQAAAPTGVSGVVALSHPALDAAGSLLLLRADRLDSAALGRSPCAHEGGSALAVAGRGGLPALASGALGLRAEAAAAARASAGCR